jgi:hypothetical protein
MYIPLWRTFLNWFMALVAGSFCWPVIAAFFEESIANDSGGLITVMLISLLFFGAVFIPGLLIMLLVNRSLNRRELAPGRFFRVYTMVNGLTGLLTFLVVYMLDNPSPNNVVILFYVTASGSYIISALAIWMITYRIYRRKTDYKESNDELLDEF